MHLTYRIDQIKRAQKLLREARDTLEYHSDVEAMQLAISAAILAGYESMGRAQSQLAIENRKVE
jgi:hypothetical protein